VTARRPKYRCWTPRSAETITIADTKDRIQWVLTRLATIIGMSKDLPEATARDRPSNRCCHPRSKDPACPSARPRL